MLITSIFVTISSVVSWAVAFAGIWHRWTPAWAAMTGVIAALCWIMRWRDRSETRLFIRSLGVAIQLIPEDSRPPLVRAVPAVRR